ncbi:carboxylesterase [Phlyctema vagabunda]|uniref:Carboxylic ester hydrolase n=1 Tax=Phlyctema vagabunda TaxID=108571 RepID=A0ABR4P5J6_9HELO
MSKAIELPTLRKSISHSRANACRRLIYCATHPSRWRLLVRKPLFWVVLIMLIAAITLCSLLPIVQGYHGKLTVDLGYAKYRGVHVGHGINEWLGIRFAAPPLGDLRWRAPQPPLVNDTLIDADTHGPVCLPTPSSSLPTVQNEDCLFLDVYAPSKKSSKLLPVHVHFQGGGFNNNADPNLDGGPLIRAGEYDMIVVTFNYRVGPWGFLASKEVVADGDLNVGLLDQRFVLQWVQKYIQLFGGDPKHVTIGGASAGAASVNLHLSAYGGRDDGLFIAAAAESQSFGAQMTVEESQYQYDALVSRVGCADTTSTLKCLRDLDVSLLAEDNVAVPSPGGAGENPVFMYSNVIDGDFTPDYTYRLFEQGKFIKVPVIFGSVTNEGTSFTPKHIANYTSVNNFLKNNWVKLTEAQLAQIDFYYPKAEQFPNSGAYWRTAANAYGEMRYNCPGIYLSGQYPSYGYNASWNYHWDVVEPAKAINGLGVTHVSESPAIWGTASWPAKKLTPTIQGYWTSFIRSGNPNTYRLPDSPVWEVFNSETQQRIYFPNDVSNVAMQSVPEDQKERCAYLTSIGVSIAQ